MTIRLTQGSWMSRLMHGQRGGVAIFMLVAFVAMAVPISVAATSTAGQLARSSQVYDSRLTGMYNAGAGIEVALHELLNDSTFDDGLTPSDPDMNFTVDTNGDTVTVTVTKIFGSQTLQGQSVILTKAVTPTSAPANTLTTFTYTITVKNEGTDTVTLEQIKDHLPPGFEYVDNSTGGDITTSSNPDDINGTGNDCGMNSWLLTWDLSPFVGLAAGEEKTLTFDATADVDDGTYHNQAIARYDPWWPAPDLEVYSPLSASVDIGTGTPNCGYGAKINVSKAVSPSAVLPGLTTFTYTISVVNWSNDTLYMCQVGDLLPPTFSYETSSSGDYPSNIDTSEPNVTWESDYGRWELDWSNAPTEGTTPPLSTIAAGATQTQTFRTTADVESGNTYNNDVWAVYADTDDHCEDAIGGQGGGGKVQGGASSSWSATVAPLYDIQAVAADGTVLSRIVFFESEGQIDLLSWQGN